MMILVGILILLLELAILGGLVWAVYKVRHLTHQFKTLRQDWILKVMEAKSTLKSVNQTLKQVEVPLNISLVPKSLPGKLAFWGVRAATKVKTSQTVPKKPTIHFQTLQG